MRNWFLKKTTLFAIVTPSNRITFCFIQTSVILAPRGQHFGPQPLKTLSSFQNKSTLVFSWFCFYTRGSITAKKWTCILCEWLRDAYQTLLFDSVQFDHVAPTTNVFSRHFIEKIVSIQWFIYTLLRICQAVPAPQRNY